LLGIEVGMTWEYGNRTGCPLDLLQERGWSREQAYVISSVVVDPAREQCVDVANHVASAFLPEALFQD
jgi:acetamidase/formamidase